MINVDKHVYSLAKRYSRLLKAYGGDYDDVLQEARIVAASLSTDIPDKEYYWRLRHDLLHNCIRYYRINRKSIKSVAATDYDAGVAPDDMRCFDNLVCYVANVDDQLDAEAYLKSLPDRERDVLRRQYFHGQTMSEIASDLGLSTSTVKDLHLFAIKRLQGTLDSFLVTRRAARRASYAARAAGKEVPDKRKKPNKTRLIDRIKGGDLTVLTDEERSCVLLSRDGLTGVEIASRLGLSVSAVAHKLRFAYFKLSGQYRDLQNRTNAQIRERRRKRNARLN